MSDLRVLWTGAPDPATGEVESRLRQELPGLVLETAYDTPTLRRRLAEPWDVVLAGQGGREAVLEELRSRGLTIPVVLLSPTASEPEVGGVHRSGAQENAVGEGTFAQRLPDVLQALARRRQAAEGDPTPYEPGGEEHVQALEVLVAGLAHDLNNLLQAISGHGEIAREELVAPESARRNLDEILRAVRRARHLVEEIRGLGRAHERAPSATCVLRATEEALDLLGPALPPGVVIERRLSKQVGAVLTAEGEVQRIVLNLAANAIEAMGGRGGRLALSLEETSLAEDEASALGLPTETSYARLTVEDDGGGMDPATRERAFEPFFSTKTARCSRGLGLSVVRGLVHARGGAVSLESQPGRGTRVRVWLPALPARSASAASAIERARTSSGVPSDESAQQERALGIARLGGASGARG